MDGMKPQELMTFREVAGVWRRVDSPSQKPPTLAETLENLEIIIDDKCVFARFKDYEKNLSIWYRANSGKITITIWKIIT